MSDGLTNIKIFVAAYEERTFTAAANREAMTQSGVSQRIAQLEHAIGAKLFKRSKSGVVPTPVADIFYPNCTEILRTHHLAILSAKGFGKGLEGDITLGIIPALSQSVLAPAILRYTNENPNVRLSIVEGFGTNLTDALLANDLDFALVPAFAGRTGLHLSRLASLRQVFVTAHGKDRYIGDPADLSQIGPLKLVVPRGETGSEADRRRSLGTYLEGKGARIERMIEMSSMSAALSLVAQSDWSCVLPWVAVARHVEEARLSIYPLEDPNLHLDVVTITRIDRCLSPAGEAFRDVLLRELAQIEMYPRSAMKRPVFS